MVHDQIRELEAEQQQRIAEVSNSKSAVYSYGLFFYCYLPFNMAILTHY